MPNMKEDQPGSQLDLGPNSHDAWETNAKARRLCAQGQWPKLPEEKSFAPPGRGNLCSDGCLELVEQLLLTCAQPFPAETKEAALCRRHRNLFRNRQGPL